MCIGTPMQVVEAGEFDALCAAGGGSSRVDLALVGPQPAGTWLLVFLGAAREVLTEEDALRIRDAHQALRDILNGASPDIDAQFADLAGREPTLPAHLLQPGTETT